MDQFDQMSDHQVTWLDIASMFIILAFILGCLSLVSLFAGSPQTAQGLTGGPAIAEKAVERDVVDRQ